MPRYKEPPWGFKCPYTDHCPGLQGLSTSWIFSEYQRSHIREHEYWLVREKMNEEMTQLLRTVRRQDEQIDELIAENKRLHQQQFKPKRESKQKKVDSLGAETEPAKKKKRGAPKGHPAWNRKKPERVDRTVEVDAPCLCPVCQTNTDLSQTQTSSYLQEDIVLCPQTIVTEYTHTSAWCPTCKKQVDRVLDGELCKAPIGPNAKVAALFLRHELRLSYRQVSRAMSTLFGLDFVPASTLGFEKKTRHNATPVYEDLIDKIRACDLVHADETHWREDGESHFIWYAGNSDIAVFRSDPSRSSEAAKKLLGDQINGLLVADAYAGYNAIKVEARQSCLAHLIRKAGDILTLLESKKYPDYESISFCQKLIKLFTLVCRITVPPGKQQRRELKQRYFNLLDSFCSIELGHKKAETLRNRLIPSAREYNEVFAFIDFDGPPTNNHAERSLRPLVIFRKTSMGTRSRIGSENITLFASILQTAKLQASSVIPVLSALLTGTPAKVRAAVFDQKCTQNTS